MAATRVATGTMATAAAATITPAFAQATTAGNLLVLSVAEAGSNLNAPTVTGWTLVLQQAGSVNSLAQGVAIYIKPNCGASETAPAVAWSSATTMWAKLEEWSGLGTTDPTDHIQTGQAVSSLTMATADTTAADLLVAVFVLAGTKSATITVGAPTVAPGTPTSTASTNDGATKALNHAYMWSGVMSSNASADAFTPSFTPSTGTVLENAGLASFKPPAAARGPQSPPIVVRQAVTRAGNF